MVQSQHP